LSTSSGSYDKNPQQGARFTERGCQLSAISGQLSVVSQIKRFGPEADG
jgi:hypothetical protein